MQGLVQWMQGWLGFRQRDDQTDQHLKQDTRSYVEDPRRLARIPRQHDDQARKKRCHEKKDSGYGQPQKIFGYDGSRSPELRIHIVLPTERFCKH